jgi:hypothetical protein
LYLGTKLTPDEFTVKCFPRGEANWEFEYPEDRLLPLMGITTDDLMRTPDMWDSDGEPCLLVVKSANATDTTIVREYFNDMSLNRTSMEWGIINYDSKSEVFSEPGDSGSVIADIRGRIGGMLTGGSGKAKSSDMTYATLFWWLLERIKANGNAHLGVVAQPSRHRHRRPFFSATFLSSTSRLFPHSASQAPPPSHRAYAPQKSALYWQMVARAEARFCQSTLK